MLAALVAVIVPLASLYAVMAAVPSSGRFASSLDSAPPPPPTFVPTPIGNPPNPPTPTATAGPPLPTATPDGTPGPTAIPTTASEVNFTVDAVRVSKVNNPGNLQGLASVKPGTKVWLMLYYTIDSLPRTLTRLTSYTVLFHGRTIFKVTYKNSESVTDHGHFSRYTVYTVPKNLPFGQYTYHATLTLGGTLRSKSWRFLIGKHERVGRLSSG